MPVVDVPQIPQWSPTANRFRNDCGPACVGMCLSWDGKLGGLTVDQLALETGLRNSDSGLMPDALVKLAAKHDLPTSVNVGTTEDDIRQEILSGKPVIALVAYRFLLNRLDQADNVPGRDGHYVVITGFNEEQDRHFLINDPDVWEPYVERGHNMLIPATELQRGLAPYYGQCLFMESSMTLSEQLTVEAQKIEALAALVAQLESNPPASQPVVDPLPGTPMEKVIQAGVNVRWDTVVDPGTLLDGLIAGTRVTIQGTKTINNHTWASLLKVGDTARTYKVGDRLVYGYIATDIAFPKA